MRHILLAALSALAMQTASAAIIERMTTVDELSAQSGVAAAEIINLTGVLQHEKLYVSQPQTEAGLFLTDFNGRRGPNHRPGRRPGHHRHRPYPPHRPHPRHDGCPWGTISVKLGKLGHICVRVGR